MEVSMSAISKLKKKMNLGKVMLVGCVSFIPMHLQGDESMPCELVDVQSIIPNARIDLKYATADNFTGQIVYDFGQCFLLKEVALKLREVQDELEPMGLGLKIWDGFRPVAAQWKFWELVPDERYVSDPRKGGRHTRGTAVDLTLVTKDGQELLMPSAFDDFSERAHRNYTGATEEAIKNREFLQKIMESRGFIGLPTEWWHFDFIGWENRDPLSVNLTDSR
jgi:D-alanyl-D-alanine dipeptidase